MSSDLSTYKIQKYLGKLQSVSQEDPRYQIYLSKYMYWLEGGKYTQTSVKLNNTPKSLNVSFIDNKNSYLKNRNNDVYKVTVINTTEKIITLHKLSLTGKIITNEQDVLINNSDLSQYYLCDAKGTIINNIEIHNKPDWKPPKK